jgi:coenzyme PQQ precursor peptide PqqA
VQAPAGADQRIVCSTAKEITMKWETPTAADFRFGFEITMYVANR